MKTCPSLSNKNFRHSMTTPGNDSDACFAAEYLIRQSGARNSVPICSVWSNKRMDSVNIKKGSVFGRKFTKCNAL